MRKSLVVSALAGAVFAPATSFAQTPPAPAAAPTPPYTLTGNVTLASDYRFRGISQTNGKPAIQGGFDFAHSSGVYLGTWLSNVSWLSDQESLTPSPGHISNSLEWDFYGGYKGTVGDFSYDAGLLQYYYPGNYPPNFPSPNTLEAYVAGGWKWFTLKYSNSLGNLFGWVNPATGENSHHSEYIDLSAAIDVGAGFNLNAHVGHQRVRHFSDASYTDWKLGVTKDFVGLTWGLAYVGTNAKGDVGKPYRNAFDRDLGKDTVVATVGKTF